MSLIVYYQSNTSLLDASIIYSYNEKIWFFICCEHCNVGDYYRRTTSADNSPQCWNKFESQQFRLFTKSKSRQLCNKNTLSIVYLYLFYHACNLSLVQVLERSQNEGKTNGCSKTLVVIGDGDVGSQIKELFDKKNREFSGNGPPVKVLVFRTTTTMERNGILYFSLLLLGKKYS